MKAFELRSDKGSRSKFVLAELDQPKLQAGQVIVKVHSVSLNYRDIQILDGTYGVVPRIPVSDGAGEVVAVAPDVSSWKIGDRVAGTFWQPGPLTDGLDTKGAPGLGGEIDGVLAELVAFDHRGLVRVPEHLSFEEAATLPCAGVTAWNALVTEANVKAGDTVLLLGTGGVSIFGLQLAKLMGAEVIITSSNEEKLQRAARLGADHGINYRTTPDWHKRVLELTNGRGADVVLDVAGSATLTQSLHAVRYNGQIEIIGLISGASSEIHIPTLLSKRISIQGIRVGSRQSFEEMNRAIALAGMKPVVDKVFPFERAPDAVAYLRSGDHFGKVVINVA